MFEHLARRRFSLFSSFRSQPEPAPIPNPTVEAIKLAVLELKPGQALLVQLPAGTSSAIAERCRKDLMFSLGASGFASAPVIFAAGDMKFSVVDAGSAHGKT